MNRIKYILSIAFFAISLTIFSQEKYNVRVLQVLSEEEVVANHILPANVESITFNKVDICKVTLGYATSGVGCSISLSNSNPRKYQTVTLEAKGSPVYEFVCWSVNGECVSGENPYTPQITEDIDFYANFQKKTGFDYEVDLKNHWRESDVALNPDPSLYYMYESNSNYNNHSQIATMTIAIYGYTEFIIYVRSDGESNWDYVRVGNLDSTYLGDTTSDFSSSIKATTRNNPNSGTSFECYTPVKFTNIDGEYHTITIEYKKDGSIHNGTDRGYILIPKQNKNN